jgi:hypothetical protein
MGFAQQYQLSLQGLLFLLYKAKLETILANYFKGVLLVRALALRRGFTA